MSARTRPAGERKPAFYLPIPFPEPVNERGPCPRNREIFDAVRIRNQSYRAAAKQFDLSPARIGQIVKEVEGWIQRTGGGPPRTWAERDRLNEYIHRQRLEMLYGHALEAWNKSGQTTTTRFYLDPQNNLQKKTISVKATPGERAYWEAALKSENARYLFEKNRPHPPNADEMTDAEKLREIQMTAEEVLAQVKPDEEKKAATKDEAAQDEAEVEELTVAEVDESEAAVSEPPPPESAPEPAVEPAPSVEPAERLHFAFPPYTAKGQMRLTKRPSAELLDQFWVRDEQGRPEWRPPLIVSGDPNGPFWFYYEPTPPTAAAMRRRERLKQEKLERERSEKEKEAEG